MKNVNYPRQVFAQSKMERFIERQWRFKKTTTAQRDYTHHSGGHCFKSSGCGVECVPLLYLGHEVAANILHDLTGHFQEVF
jgi:hypothetical protein